MPETLNNQIYALLSSATTTQQDEKREQHNMTNLKVISGVKISAAKM
jgi:hypothetical protein